MNVLVAVVKNLKGSKIIFLSQMQKRNLLTTSSLKIRQNNFSATLNVSL
jgi:hypothetical protein